MYDVFLWSLRPLNTVRADPLNLERSKMIFWLSVYGILFILTSKSSNHSSISSSLAPLNFGNLPKPLGSSGADVVDLTESDDVDDSMTISAEGVNFELLLLTDESVG